MNFCSHIKKVLFVVLIAVTGIMAASCRDSGTSAPSQKKAETGMRYKNSSDSSHDGHESIFLDSTRATTTNPQIKEIKGSQPDISKANRSKSTTVIRQTGLPKGTGKPKGSGKPARNE
jgi:hypothetical protein